MLSSEVVGKSFSTRILPISIIPWIQSMRWLDKTWRRTFQIILAFLPFALLICAIKWFSLPALGAPDPPRISVYSLQANFSVAVQDCNGQNYVSLLDLLDPIGTVAAAGDRSKWKIRYKNDQFEFNDGKTRVKGPGRDSDMPASFILDAGKGLVPVSGLALLLPRILGEPVLFHEGSSRLFIGSMGIHFTAQMLSSAPARMALNFSSSVSPSIHQEGKLLRLVFQRDALLPPASPTVSFDSVAIASLSYAEAAGAAEIDVTGSGPLVASFTKSGRTIEISAQPGAQAGAAADEIESEDKAPSFVSNRTRHYFVVLDASHGGSEQGALLADKLAEKDVTLAFGRRLRQELETRGISVLLMRDGDMNLSLDQRASLANAAHPAIYLCIHAASLGNGVHLYTTLLPPSSAGRGPFSDWSTAQAPYRETSQLAESSIVSQLQKDQVPSRILLAPLRPLNNIATAAIALELAPRQGDVTELNSSSYQQGIAASIASGVAAVLPQLAGER